MAELDRRYAQGTTVGRAEPGVIDQGLRAYMLRVYNYMASGVAITGVVAYLTYMFAVVDTGAGLQLTSFGSFIFASAFKWVVIFAPLGMVFFLSARINSMSLSGAQIAFWVFAALMGLSHRVDLPRLRSCEHRARVLHHRRDVRERSAFTATPRTAICRLGLVPVHGPDRHHHRDAGEPLPGLLGAAVRHLGDRRLGLCWAHRLRHPADQGDVLRRRRRYGRRPARRLMGALRLYLDFINLFMMLLQLFGDRR